MRFSEEAIIFAEGIIIDGLEIQGYLWATDELVALTNFRQVCDEDDNINFYPIFNSKTMEFYIEVTYTQGACFRLELQADEYEFILNELKEYVEYLENKPFEEAIKEWQINI